MDDAKPGAKESSFARDNGMEDKCVKCDACGNMVLNPCGSTRTAGFDQQGVTHGL